MIQDDFTTSPGIGWSDLTNWTMTGGHLVLGVSSQNLVTRALPGLGGTDQYIEAVVPVALNQSYADVQLALRRNATDAAGYGLVLAYQSTTTHRWWLRRYNPAGGNDVLELTSSVTIPALVPPFTLRLEVEGTTLRAYANGALLGTVEDATVTSGDHPGLGGYRSGTESTGRRVAFESVEAGTLGTGPTPPPTPTGVTLEQAPDSAQVTWNASAGATGYDVQRETYTDGVWGGTLTWTETGTTSTDLEFTDLVWTRYRVRATAGEMTSGWSAWVMSTVHYEGDLSADFRSATLPTGWTAQAGAGTVAPTAEWLRLYLAQGVVADGPSASVSAPQGPLVWRGVEAGAPFDLAVALAEEPNNLPYQGLDLLAMDDGAGVARFCLYSGAMTGSFRLDHNYYVYDGASQAVEGNTSQLYGAPGWLRLRYQGGRFTFFQSRTGLAGSWVQISDHATTLTPTRFALHGLCTQAGQTGGREQRLSAVVDLLARPDDGAAETPPTDRQRTTAVQFDGATVPGTPSTAAGGTVTVASGALRLAISNAVAGSHAGVTFGPLGDDHGMLLRYRVSLPGYLNAFWVPAVAIELATTLEGAQVVDDKWGPGNSMLMEMPARQGTGTAHRTVRMLRRSPVPDGQAQTGNREFDGYTMLHEDLAFPIDTNAGQWTWMRLEKLGRRFRVRIWLDGQAEPATWDQEVEDHARRGNLAALSVGSNDSSAGGTDAAAVEFSTVEAYSLAVPTDGPTYWVLLPSGEEVPATIEGVLLPGGAVVPAVTEVATN